MLNKQLVDKVLSKFNLRTKDYTHFLIAFTHSTYANEHKIPSNERIEFLGDSVLGMLCAEYIYHNFPKLSEGEMSKMRATYVCEDANFSYSQELGLDQILLLGVGEEQTGGRKKTAVIADTFECFLGAVFLTFGINAVKDILAKIVFPHIKATDDKKFIDYKSKLQELVQSENKKTLIYRTIKEEGPAHKKVFTRSAYMDNIVLGTGTGNSKKDADQAAAKNALSKLAK